jgi:hypothetical protein
MMFLNVGRSACNERCYLPMAIEVVDRSCVNDQANAQEMMIPLATMMPGDDKASCLVQPPQDAKMVRNLFDDGSADELVVATIDRSVIHRADETGAH